MRALAACILALGIVASPVLAAAAPGDKDSAGSSSSSTAAAQPVSAPAPAATADPAAKAEPSSMEVATELQQLRELLDAQARQLQAQQQKMELLEEQLKATNAAASGDPESVSGATSAALASNAALGGSSDDKPGPPTSITYKGVTITPGGFMAAETVWRQKAMSSDVNTPFNSITFAGSSASHITEFNASGRQSRFSLLTEGKLDNVKIGGYYETDFLSSGTTSNDNQSNSYSLRQRQFWAQAAFTDGFTVTGGQQWSLLTETSKGMDNRSENLPMTIDANYSVGFSWARQYGFRVTKNFNNKIWLGMSVEEAQTNAVTVHGNTTANAGGTTVVTCTTLTAGICTATGTALLLPTVQNNFLIGQFGVGGGLYNATANYAYNLAPDVIVKAVFEPGFGHYEVFGVVSQFRDRVFPCVYQSSITPGCNASTTSGFGAFNDSRVGGGIGGNARWSLLQKKVDLGVHFLGGSGIGRYGSGGLPDATARPDGTLALLRNYQALGTLQLHPISKLDVYMNVGGEYAGRAAYSKANVSGPFAPCNNIYASTGSGLCNEGYGYGSINNSGCFNETQPITGPSTGSNTGVPSGVGGGTGFIPGPLSNCTGDTRNLIEGTLGFWYRFYNGPKGRVQFGMQYSNFIRNTWKGIGTGSGTGSTGQPHADENMVLTSFRYYLP